MKLQLRQLNLLACLSDKRVPTVLASQAAHLCTKQITQYEACAVYLTNNLDHGHATPRKTKSDACIEVNQAKETLTSIRTKSMHAHEFSRAEACDTSTEAKGMPATSALRFDCMTSDSRHPKGTMEDGGVAMRLCCFTASSLNIIFSSFLADRASLCITTTLCFQAFATFH